MLATMVMTHLHNQPPPPLAEIKVQRDEEREVQKWLQLAGGGM